MILRDGNIGESYIVKKIDLPKDAERRLEILGMTENTSISIVNKKKSGSMIIRIRGTRFAIGKGFSEKITVDKGKEDA